MGVLADLDAVSTEHLRCGDLDGGADGPVCDCRASMARLDYETYDVLLPRRNVEHYVELPRITVAIE